MKKVIALLCLCVLSISGVFANYSYNEMVDAANDLAQREIIKDKSITPSEYNLNDNVLRQEIGLIAMRLAKLEKKSSCSNIFSDISATNPNDWACVHIEPLVEKELISKNDVFRPGDNITKAESLKMLIKAIGFDFEYDASSSVSWQKQYVDFAVENEILDNFTDYNTLASRGWVFMVANHTIVVKEKQEIIEKKKIDEGLYSDEVMKDVEYFLQNF
ncbi:MAG: S-layer homology domain-containing protein [Candidatus Gracilibacteria bacterium]|nr:S-layer homology domain-containing protein [Candidatus Gracilibacteria bacterium]